MAWKTKLAELLVEIKAPIGPLKSAMAKAGAIVKRGMSTMGRWARRGALAIGVGLAAALVYATKAAMKQEDAEIDLAAALRTTGDATESNIARLKRYAAELQKTTIYGDEEILAQMAYAKNLGVTTDKLEESAKAAIGLAAAYKLDLSAAMMLVGRASQGQTQMLTRYGIVLREGLSDQEKFNEVLHIGAAGFGLAEEKAKGTRGVLTRLWNVIGDIAEVIAKPLLERLLEAATNTLVWVQANKELVATKVGEWIGKLIAGLEKLAPVMKFVAKYWKGFLGVMAAFAIAPGIVAIGKIINFLGLATAAVVKFGKTVTVVAKAGLAFVVGAKAVADVNRLDKLGVALKSASTPAKRLALYITKLLVKIKSLGLSLRFVVLRFKLAGVAAKSMAIAGAAGIAVIVAEVVLLLRALWQIYNYKRILRKQGKAATKEEIQEYKDRINALDKEAAARRKAARAKKEAGAAERAALIKKNEAERAAAKEVHRVALAEYDARKERENSIEVLENQLEMYKEMVGFEKEIADIEAKLRKERARDIGKELDIPGRKVLDKLELKIIQEDEAKQKEVADEAARKAKEAADEKLRMQDELYTDAKGYEKELSDTRKNLRLKEAAEYAKVLGISAEEAYKILTGKLAGAATLTAKVGLTGFEQAWAQIATGASQTEKEIAKATKETAKYTKTIAEKTTIIANKKDTGGFGP